MNITKESQDAHLRHLQNYQTKMKSGEYKVPYGFDRKSAIKFLYSPSYNWLYCAFFSRSTPQGIEYWEDIAFDGHTAESFNLILFWIKMTDQEKIKELENLIESILVTLEWANGSTYNSHLKNKIEEYRNEMEKILK
jgi:hypothetical protein